MKPCPFCQKKVQDNAHKCKHCDAWFTDDADVKQKVIDREEQAKQLFKQKKDKAGEDLADTTVCFSVSAKKMVVMSVLSFGLYEFYWFFQNWLAIRRQENKKVSPFWRSVFSVFYCYTFFKRILISAVSREGYKGKDVSGNLAGAYILLSLVSSNAPFPLDQIGLFSFVPLLYVNNAIRFNNRAIDPYYQERVRLTAGELAIVVFGVLLWALIIVDFFFPEMRGG